MKSFFKKRVVQIVGACVLVVVIIAGAFGGGVILGYQNRPAVDSITSLTNKATDPEVGTADFSLFWTAWKTLNDNYVTASSTSPQDRVYAAIQGLAQAYGDPYTVFMPPSEAADFNTQISGTLAGGVGMEVGTKDGQLVVLAPLKGSPAEAAGIKSGDDILKH